MKAKYLMHDHLCIRIQVQRPKPEAKPIGTPIDIRANNPTISIIESVPISNSILF